MDKAKWFEREWLLTVAGIVGTVWGMAESFIPKEQAMKVLAFLLTLYTLSRIILKAAEIIVKFTKSTKDDELIAKISAALDILGEKLPKQPSATPPAS